MSTDATASHTFSVLGATAILASFMIGPPATALAVTEPPPALAPVEDCRPPTFVRGVHEGFPVESSALPSTGSARITSIYVDFSDAPGDPAAIAGYEQMLDQGGTILSTQSGDRLTLERSTSGTWDRLPVTAAEYQAVDPNDVARRLLTDTVSVVDGHVDFSSTDVLWLILAPSVITSTSEELHNNVEIPTAEGTVTRAIVFNGADFEPEKEWLVVHESGHSLGLPDLYSAFAEDADFIHRFAGGWDPMGATFSARGREFLGWHLWRLGWIEDDAVSCVVHGTLGAVLIDSVGLRGHSTIAVVRVSEFEVIVVESRHADRYDEFLAGTATGALVYRVNTDLGSGYGPIRVVMPDGVPPFVDLGTSYDAVLTPGQRYSDPSGVVIEALPRPDPTAHQDLVRIDTRALAPAPVPDEDDLPADGGSPAEAAGAARLPETGARDLSPAGLGAVMLAGVGVALLVIGRRMHRRERPTVR